MHIHSLGRHERKRPLSRYRYRWEDNIRMDLSEIGWEGMWTRCICVRVGTTGGVLVNTVFHKKFGISDYLSDYQLVKEDSVA